MIERQDGTVEAERPSDPLQQKIRGEMKRITIMLSVLDKRTGRLEQHALSTTAKLDELNDKLDFITWHLIAQLILILLIGVGLLLAYAGAL